MQGWNMFYSHIDVCDNIVVCVHLVQWKKLSVNFTRLFGERDGLVQEGEMEEFRVSRVQMSEQDKAIPIIYTVYRL